ncbi:MULTISPECIES: hypothetical protein [unclassified Anabaena]|uniref:hypothetical protein n=1 Tax=unclassified Anabaena TaxID=2619674 RepID=UPI00082C2BCF|nr:MULTISPECIES: hypothetical protein [unclassified Anabaena]
MKPKLLNVLTVCLVTFAVVSPGLVVLNFVWEKHIEFVKTQKLLYEVSKLNATDTSISISNINQNSSQALFARKSPTCQIFNQMLANIEHYKILIIFQWLIILTPAMIGLGIVIYDKYLIYRASLLQAQIEMLERLWQQSIEQ